MHRAILADSRKTGGAHHLLARLVGEWEGTTRTYLEPGVLAEISQTYGTIRPLLDGRFVLHEYRTSMDGEVQQGFALYGCNLGTGLFESAWVDSYHMGSAIMTSLGERMPDGFFVLGSYPDYSGGPDWGWRTEIELVEDDDDNLRIRAYNITPQGAEALAVETEYRRLH